MFWNMMFCVNNYSHLCCRYCISAAFVVGVGIAVVGIVVVGIASLSPLLSALSLCIHIEQIVALFIGF